MQTKIGRLTIESQSAATALAVGTDTLGAVDSPFAARPLAKANLKLTDSFQTRSKTLKVSLTPEEGTRAALLVEVDGALEWVLPTVPAGQDTLGGGQLEFVYQLPAELDAVRDGLGSFAKKLKAFVFEFVIPVLTGQMTLLEAIEEGLGHENAVLRITSSDPVDWRPLKAGGLREGDRILVLIHGTFSQLTGSFGHLIEHSGETLEDWIRGYDHVLGLNHFTLAHTPSQNAELLVRALAGVQGLQVDLIGTSRGALVIRALLEDFSTDFEVRQVIGVCPAFGGTKLAAPENWKQLLDTITNLAKAVAVTLPGTATAAAWVLGIAGFLKALSALVFGDLQAIPGLAAMNPEGEYLEQLNQGSNPDLPEYTAVTSDYEGQAPERSDILGPPMKQAARAALFAADRVVDALFEGQANDLVVDNDSGERVGKTSVSFVRMNANSSVHHLNHLACAAVLSLIEVKLFGQAQMAGSEGDELGWSSGGEGEDALAEAGSGGDWEGAEPEPDVERGEDKSEPVPRYFQLEALAEGESTRRTRALKWNAPHTLFVSIGPLRRSAAAAHEPVSVSQPQRLSLLTQSLVPGGISPRLDALDLPEQGSTPVLRIAIPAAQSVALGFTLFNQSGRMVHQYQWFPPSLPGDEAPSMSRFRPLAVSFQPESDAPRPLTMISGPQSTLVKGQSLVAANLAQVDHLTERLSSLIEAAPVGTEAGAWRVPPSQAAETWKQLARVGSELLGQLFEGAPGMRESFVLAPAIQVLSLDASRVLPVELIYLLPAPHKDDVVEIFGPEVAVPESPGDRRQVYLSAFVGLSKRIERLNLPTDPDLQRDFSLRLAPRDEPRVVPLEHVLFGGSHRVELVAKGSMSDLDEVLRSALKGRARVQEALDWPEWKSMVKQRDPKLLILLPHTEPDTDGELRLELGEESFEAVLDLDEESLGQEPLIVLLLGCNTGNTHGFEHVVGRLSRKGVVACVATLSTIRGRHAAPIAARLVQALLDKGNLGDAVLHARRTLVSDGYPIAMTLVGFGDIDVGV